MDVIILAAGENVRLQAAGLAPGMKPLIIVKNEVLIRRLARQAREVAVMSGDRVIIVCSPDNAREVCFASNGYADHYVIQPEPKCPQEAVDRAMPLVQSEHVMLLMGDNYIEEMPDFVTSPSITITRDFRTHSLKGLWNGSFWDLSEHPGGSPDALWLGPIVFPKVKWREGHHTWTFALPTVKFTYIEATGIKDMGVLT